MKSTRYCTIELTLALNDKYTPLQKAIATAAAYGIGDMGSVVALFHPFSRPVVARAVQQLVMDDVLVLHAAEKRLALSQAMTTLHGAVADINRSSQVELAQLLEDDVEPGVYQVGSNILEAMMSGQEGGALDARKVTLLLKVSA